MSNAVAACLVCGAPLEYFKQAQDVTCAFFNRNAECLKENCPFYPKG